MYLRSEILYSVTNVLLQIGWYIFGHVLVKLWIIVNNVKNLAPVVPTETNTSTES